MGEYCCQIHCDISKFYLSMEEMLGIGKWVTDNIANCHVNHIVFYGTRGPVDATQSIQRLLMPWLLCDSYMIVVHIYQLVSSTDCHYKFNDYIYHRFLGINRFELNWILGIPCVLASWKHIIPPEIYARFGLEVIWNGSVVTLSFEFT